MVACHLFFRFYSEHFGLVALDLEFDFARVLGVDLALVDLGGGHRCGELYYLLSAL